MAEYLQEDGTTILDGQGPKHQAESSVRVLQLGAIADGEDQVLDFSQVGCVTTGAVTGTVEFDVSSVGVGQRAALHILAGDPAPTVTIVGVDAWSSLTEPVFTAGVVTLVYLFNDGTRIIGDFGECA